MTNNNALDETTTQFTEQKTQIHRFNDYVALSLAGLPTKYLDNEAARTLATLLQDYARDIDIYSFTKSKVGTFAEYLTVKP